MEFRYIQFHSKRIIPSNRSGGVVVWIVSDGTENRSETGTSFRQALYFKDIGFNIHDTMIWNKGSTPFPCATRYNQTFEYMFVFSKGKPKTVNLIKDKLNKFAGTSSTHTERQRDGTIKRISRVGQENYHYTINEYGARNNVWDMPPEKANKTGHPAVFPVNLVADHIKTWSNENDIVLDPFLGSGTTAIASFITNRNFIGYEIDKQYFDIATKRISNYTNQLTL